MLRVRAGTARALGPRRALTVAAAVPVAAMGIRLNVNGSGDVCYNDFLLPAVISFVHRCMYEEYRYRIKGRLGYQQSIR